MTISISDPIKDGVWGRRRTLAVGWLKLPWPFPIADGLGGSGAIVFGWPVFGAEAPKYVAGAFRIFSRIRNAKWWLRHRLSPKHQHHVIRTGLEPSYYDCDTLMLHGCMALLCRYIEDEMGGADRIEKFNAELREPGSEGHGPRECVESQADRQATALEIYRWWKHQKPADEKRRDELMMALYTPSRMSSVPTDNPRLNQLIFKEFEGDELAMEAEFRKLEAKIEDEEQVMLHRLIDIRRSLWT